MSAITQIIARAVNPGRLERAVCLGLRPDQRTHAVWEEDAEGRCTDARDYTDPETALREFSARCQARKVRLDTADWNPREAFLFRVCAVQTLKKGSK